MKGQEQIIKARIAGAKPAFVFVNDYDCPTDWFEFNDHATVCTAGDNIQALDFRFLVNCQVSISAESEARAKSLFNQIKQSGAGVVAACHIQRSQHALNQAGWAEVWRKNNG